jgi:PEP-CTERM motif-containing protein
MRVARVLCFLIIFGSSAIAAYAQTSVDPLVKVEGVGDPACGGSGQPVCFDGSGPLVETYGSPVSFVYDCGEGCTTPLYSMTLEFIDVPPPPPTLFFECETNIWTDCSQGSSGPTTVEFSFFDTPPDSGGPPCSAGGGTTCPGYMTPNEEATVTITPLVSDTPEPSTIILFGTGLILLFVGSKRRVHARI